MKDPVTIKTLIPKGPLASSYIVELHGGIIQLIEDPMIEFRCEDFDVADNILTALRED